MNFVVVTVAFADQAGNGPHAATCKIDQEAVLGPIVGIHVLGDVELRIGLQGHHATIGEPDLRTAGGTGDYRVATFQIAPLVQGNHRRATAHIHIP